MQLQMSDFAATVALFMSHVVVRWDGQGR